MLMRSKISSKWSWFALGALGAVFLAIALLSFAFVALDHGSSLKSAPAAGSYAPQVARMGIPVRLRIPKISVDAAIEDVGLTSQGAMAVPAGPTDVAWFALGPRPGEVGSAVIAGHEGWKNNIPAAFDFLYRLKIGDIIYADDAQGAATTFVVRAVQTYTQNGNAADVFGSSDGKAHLNLITCEGTWNAATKSYSNRLVVFADKTTE